MADIDGYISRKSVKSFQDATNNSLENLANAIALGVKEEDVYIQSKSGPKYYTLAWLVTRKITLPEFEAVYGNESTYKSSVGMGKFGAVALQIADILHPQLEEFEGPMPSITVIGFDQDNHLRLTRDVSKKFKDEYNFWTPSALEMWHQPGLKEGAKMSKSLEGSAVYLTDTVKQAKKKIMSAFTGGQKTVELQKKLGGVPERCPVFHISNFHDSNTDEVYEKYYSCKRGELACGDCKRETTEFITSFIEKHELKLDESFEIAENILSKD